MPQGPLLKYRKLIADGELRDDAAQRLAIEKLQLLHRRLQGYNPAKPSRFGLGILAGGASILRRSRFRGCIFMAALGAANLC